MKSVFKWFLRAVIALIVLVILLLVVGFFVVNSNSFQNKMLQRADAMLEEKLQTRVDIDSISFNLLTLNAELYGLYIEDRQHRPMLRADLLKANADLLPIIIDGVVRVNEARLQGIRAEIHHILVASRLVDIPITVDATYPTTPSTPYPTTSSSSTLSSATTTPTKRNYVRN